MITSKEVRIKLETIMEMIKDKYPKAKYDNDLANDIAIYKLAKRVYEEADEMFYFGFIDYDDGDYDEDFEAISQLLDKLECEIEMMKEDLNILINK